MTRPLSEPFADLDDLPGFEDDPRPNAASLRRRVFAASVDMNNDELEVLAEIAERIARGRKQYGGLDLDRDGRDFARETLEEIFDGMAYTSCWLVRKQRDRR